MIDQIRLTNFKCFESLSLDLAPLTLLTGFNAGGKSTATQTLLLLSQTLRGLHDPTSLLLNGPLVNLGTPVDVLNATGGSKQMSFGVRAGDADGTWHFEVPEGNRRFLNIRSIEGIVASQLQRLIYLSAGRQVDTQVFPGTLNGDAPPGDVGPLGQYAAAWLHELGEDDAPAERRHPDSSNAASIRQQVNTWIGDLFPGAQSNAVPVLQTDLMLLQLRSGVTSDWVRPANIGYGISYAFPIVVAALCAAAQQTVILDSPEAHLHPRAQSRIGRFLAQMSSAGVQMVVETHSDHVLNGVRIAIRDGLIAPEQTAIYFFSGRPEARVIRLSVDKHGTIHDLPEGFFDQAERDLGNLAGWN